jgi:hypothetical protein
VFNNPFAQIKVEKTHIAYCWAEIEGFSKAFSYVGNGSADGPFVYWDLNLLIIIIKTNMLVVVGLLKIVQEVQIIQMVLNYMQIHLLLMMTLMVLLTS